MRNEFNDNRKRSKNKLTFLKKSSRDCIRLINFILVSFDGEKFMVFIYKISLFFV